MFTSPLDSHRLETLYNLKRNEIKYDLNVMKIFDEFLNKPHQDFSSFHVAGTNGKGSTASLIFNVIREKYRTGLYTSPHIRRFNERIFIHDREISDSEIEGFLNKVDGFIMDNMKVNRNPTFFEVTTELAFNAFKENKLDFGVIEVGLGGRLDATNVIDPKVSVITKIGFDHADRLGGTLQSIAFEKAGIIKNGKPTVTSEIKIEAINEIRSVARRRNSRLVEIRNSCKLDKINISEDGISFALKTDKNEYEIRSKLIGDFQIDNICSAVKSIEESGIDIDPTHIQDGISKARWPGRFEILRKDPRILIDCSHNPPAANSLSIAYNKMFNDNPIMLIGMLSDKDHYSYVRNIRKISNRVIFTRPAEPGRSLDPNILLSESGNLFKEAKVIEDPVEAYEYSKSLGESVLVTGSMYLVGVVAEIENMNTFPY